MDFQITFHYTQMHVQSEDKPFDICKMQMIHQENNNVTYNAIIISHVFSMANAFRPIHS